MSAMPPQPPFPGQPMQPPAPPPPSRMAGGRGQPPQPPRRGGLKIFAVLVTIFFFLSVVVNLVLLLVVVFMGAGGVSGGAAAGVQAETVHSGSRDKIAILPVEGDVDDAMYEQIKAYCQYVENDDSIKAVVLSVDSPGGGITSADEIHHLFMNLKGTGRKLVVSMRSVAASGAYYVSMPADKLYAEPTTLTGSIGVIWPAFEITGLMKNVGVTPEIIKSDSSSTYKDAGSPFKQFTDLDRAYIKGLVNAAQVKFTDVVDAGRKGKLKVPMNQIAIGKLWTADEALKLGVIDDIAYPDEVCSKTAAELGLSDPTIIRLHPRVTLMQELLAKSNGTPKVEVKVSPDTLEQLTSPHLQYRAEIP